MQQLNKVLSIKDLMNIKWSLFFVAILLFIFVSVAPALAVPSIKITSVSSYGNVNGIVEGIVTGVNYSNYYVATYIQVDEVWWTKPYLNSPRCTINLNGTFSCDTTTGGCDQYATAIAVQLMPKDHDPIICFPCQSRPKNPDAVVSANRNRFYPKSFAFSGYRWRVKKAPNCKLGPGPNYFSDTPSDVWVDGKGLHLRISKDVDNKWYSSEVILQQSLGYGTYIFQTNSRVDVIDPNMVLGLFTWDSLAYHFTHREMDIEFTRWGNPNESTNAQYVLQPCSQCPGCSTNCSRFLADLTDTNKYITTYMIWVPESVEFRSYNGQYWDNPPDGALIHQWTRTGANVPTPGKANIRLNFWLFNGNAPLSGEGSEVIIENFVFRPRCLP